MILVERAEPFFPARHTVKWYTTSFLGNEICKEIIGLFVIRYGRTILGNQASLNRGPDHVTCPILNLFTWGLIPWGMTPTVGTGKLGLREKTASDQYSCSIIINNLTTHSVFSFFDLLLSSCLIVLLPQMFALWEAEDVSAGPQSFAGDKDPPHIIPPASTSMAFFFFNHPEASRAHCSSEMLDARDKGNSLLVLVIR